MFSRALCSAASAVKNSTKSFSTSSKRHYKVVIAGAAGGIGQPLSLLLKQHALVSRLAVYDVARVTPGVGVDLSHVNTRARITGHIGPEQLDDALRDADVVLITAGLARVPGMTREDLFNANASVIHDLTQSVANNAPKAVIAIITNPVNSMVPIAAEVLKKYGVFDPARVLGVTTLDVVRAASFIGEINGVDPRSVAVPVIGGHSGVTIIPVLSQSQPAVSLTGQDKIQALTKRIQEAGTEVVKAKAGSGSATLSMAYAGARITDAILKGLKGVYNVVECAYMKSELTEAAFFASPVRFGPGGGTPLDFGTLSDYESQLLKKALPELIQNIKVGVDFVKEKVIK